MLCDSALAKEQKRQQRSNDKAPEPCIPRAVCQMSPRRRLGRNTLRGGQVGRVRFPVHHYPLSDLDQVGIVNTVPALQFLNAHTVPSRDLRQRFSRLHTRNRDLVHIGYRSWVKRRGITERAPGRVPGPIDCVVSNTGKVQIGPIMRSPRLSILFAQPPLRKHLRCQKVSALLLSFGLGCGSRPFLDLLHCPRCRALNRERIRPPAGQKNSSWAGGFGGA